MTNFKEIVDALRAAKVIRYDSEIAELLGVNRSFVSNIIKGRSEAPKSALDQLNKIYKKHISAETIHSENLTLSPEGKSKRNKVLGAYSQVPYYDVDFIAGNTMETVDSGAIQPSYYMNVPIFKDCAAFNCYSDSMQPVISKGCIIFCTYVKDWQDVLEYGQIYAISLHDNRRFLKYIMRHPEKTETHFMLRSENLHYDSFDVPKSKIKGVWLVHGWMNKNTQ